MKKQFGFSAVEALLTFVIIGILGFTGWYVYNANNRALDTYSDANASNSSVIKHSNEQFESQNVSTADWKAYTSNEGQFSIKYPETWYAVTSCSPNTLLLGTSMKLAGICGGEGAPEGQITINSYKGHVPQYVRAENGYRKVTRQVVVVNNVRGWRLTSIGSVQGVSPYPNIQMKDFVSVHYYFYTNNRTYFATYNTGYSFFMGDSEPDKEEVLNDFDVMMTKTLKLSS